MRFLLAFSISVLVLSVPTVIFGSPLDGPIVPQCEGPTCTLCHFVELARNVLRFGVALAGFLAIGLFIYIGVLHAAGVLKYANIAKAQKSLSKVVFGFILLLSAWLLVDLGISVFTGQGIRPWTSFSCGSLNWNSISTTRSPIGLNSGLPGNLGESSGANPFAPTTSTISADDRVLSITTVSADNTETADLPEMCEPTIDPNQIPKIPESATYEEGLDFLRGQTSGIFLYPEVFYIYVEKDGVGRWELAGVGSDTCVVISGIDEKIDAIIAGGADMVRVVHSHPDQSPAGSPPSSQDVAACASLQKKYRNQIDIKCDVVDGAGNAWTIDVAPDSEISENMHEYYTVYFEFINAPGVQERAKRIAEEHPDWGEAQIIEQLEQDAFDGKISAEAQRRAGDLRRIDTLTGIGKLHRTQYGPPDLLVDEYKKHKVTITRRIKPTAS